MDQRISRFGGSLGYRTYFLEGEHLESEYRYDLLLAKYFRGSTQSIKYSAFGQTQSSTGASPSRLRYTGREDDQTGLYYYRARYYDPQIGRFISEDPIGFAGGINHYAYVENNPVNANDPSGLGPEKIVELVAKGVQLIGGKLPRNAELAGSLHPVTGIPFKCNGCADFSGVAVKQVQIKATGTSSDFAAANKAAGLDKTPTGYTWHHVEDGMTMQLVPKDVHAATGHTGGSAVIRAGGSAAGLAASTNAQAADGGILGSGISWGDVGNFLIDLFTPGGVGEAGRGSDIVPRTPTHNVSPQNGYGGAAGGGFLIYPNKVNTNMTRSVYSK